MTWDEEINAASQMLTDMENEHRGESALCGNCLKVRGRIGSEVELVLRKPSFNSIRVIAVCRDCYNQIGPV